MDKNYIYQESVKEKLTFSPIEKYIKYDRFPAKLLIHILLVVATTILALSLASGSNLRYKYQRDVWFNLVGLNPAEPRNHIYTITQFQSCLSDLLKNLETLPDVVFQDIRTQDAKYFLNVEYLYPGAHVGMDLHNMSNYINQGRIFQYTIPNISAGITYPFNLTDLNSLKNFTQNVKSMVFEANDLKLRRLISGQPFHSCWRLELTFELDYYSHIMVSLNTFQKACVHHSVGERVFMSLEKPAAKEFGEKEDKTNKLANVMIFLNVIILILALFSMVLNWRYIYEMMNLYMDTRIRSKRKDFRRSSEEEDDDASYLAQMVSGKGEKNLEKILESQKAWDQLTFREKLLFFDMWFVFCIVGNFIQIWASILSITAEFEVETYRTKGVMDVLVGFSCWFAWLNLLRYLEYNKDIHLLTNVMRNSGPQIVRFMIGFLPIFFGYVFLGVCLFWRYTKFESVNEAIITLFSIIMGDLVFATFTDVVGVGIIGEIYLFSFVVLFIVCVHNIFVSIICSKAMEKKNNKENAGGRNQGIPVSTMSRTGSSQNAVGTGRGGGGPVYCDCCKKALEKTGDVKNLTESQDGDKSFDLAKETTEPKKTSSFRPKSSSGSAWENIKGFHIKKVKGFDETTGELIVNRSEKKEELRKKIFDQMMLYRKEINFLLDHMRKDAIEDVELYDLKLGQRVALKKKYKQQMEYLKSKIKSLIDPLKL